MKTDVEKQGFKQINDKECTQCNQKMSKTEIAISSLQNFDDIRERERENEEVER